MKNAKHNFMMQEKVSISIVIVFDMFRITIGNDDVRMIIVAKYPPAAYNLGFFTFAEYPASYRKNIITAIYES